MWNRVGATAYLWAVGGSQQQHSLPPLKAIQLCEQLVQCLIPLLIEPQAALATCMLTKGFEYIAGEASVWGADPNAASMGQPAPVDGTCRAVTALSVLVFL